MAVEIGDFAKLVARAIDVLGSAERAVTWLETTNATLGGATPLRVYQIRVRSGWKKSCLRLNTASPHKGMSRQVEILACRLTSKKYAHLLDGVGATSCKRNRWNQYGQFVPYAASSRALASLEMRVHSAVGSPKDAAIAVIRIRVGGGQVERTDHGKVSTIAAK